MSNKPSDSTERDRLREKVLSRWDNEGGAGEGGREHPASTELPPQTPPLANAELVQLQIRVIALENLLMVVLADSSIRQLDLACERASAISPRPGFTPHRLTVQAAARMVNLVEEAGRLRALSAAECGSDESPKAVD